MKNIIFDIGNVLVHFRPQEAMLESGIPRERQEALAKATFESKWWQELDRGFIPEEMVVSHMIEEAPELGTEISHFFEKGIRGIVKTYPYTKKWLKELKQQGYRIYLLSNYPESFFRIHWEEEFDFTEDVDGKIVSYAVKKIKPDPAIYEVLLETYGLKPEDCIFLDDREENVVVAELLGIHGIHFTGYEEACRRLAELQ